MSHVARTEGGPRRLRPHRGIFGHWLMTVALGVPWLLYRDLVWALATRPSP